MKKSVILSSVVLVAILVSVLYSVNRYSVTISDDYPILNELKHRYPSGKRITIELPTITEHYYRVYVNDKECEKDGHSNMEYSCFSFLMPNTDVTVRIEDHWVSVPEAAGQD